MTGPEELPPEPAENKKGDQAWTETRMAEEVVANHGRDIRFCGQWHKWLFWDGSRWRVDHSGYVARIVKKQIRALHLWAVRKGLPENVITYFAKGEKRSAREAVLALTAVEAEVQIAPEDFDRDPMLLSVRNGTIDLRTGKLRPHRRDDYCTKLAPVVYDPTATAPIWDAFIDRIFAANRGMVSFVQRAAGYSLTGETGEQCLFICWGGGANGKSTFLEAMRMAMGDYARAAPMDLFVASKGDRHPTEVASLLGVRFAPCVETRDGARLNEVLLKQLTGEDTVSARRMREDFWDFQPVAKLWLGTNHPPAIRGTDDAIWRRIRLVPFTITIPKNERDKNLRKKLRAELPGILAWAVRGCLAWRRDGLEPPPEVEQATDAYRETEDRIGAFIRECCVLGTGKVATAGHLYAVLVRWAEDRREYVPSAKALSEALSGRGFVGFEDGHNKVKTWRGIGLLDAVRVDAGPSTSSPYGARASETNRSTDPHRPAEDREPGSDDGDDGKGGAPCCQ